MTVNKRTMQAYLALHLWEKGNGTLEANYREIRETFDVVTRGYIKERPDLYSEISEVRTALSFALYNMFKLMCELRDAVSEETTIP